MRLGLIEAYDPQRKIPVFSVPLGLLYVASYLTKYLEASGWDVFIEEDLKKLIEAKPDVVGISSITTNFPMAVKIAKTIKDTLGIPIILGGVHITTLPHTLPSCVDVAVIGEGEETMLELMQLYLKEGKFAPEELKKIKGIVYHQERGKVITFPRKLIEPLDRIPFPQRDLYDFTGKAIMISTSRGCPYNCVFCFKTWPRYRSFSAEYVVEEIKDVLKRFPQLASIYIMDELFAISKKRLLQFINRLKKEGIEKRLEFCATIRADLVDEQICQMLKEMNITGVQLGLESGSEAILRYLKKGTITVKDNQKALDLCSQYNFFTYTSFIIGAPEESEEDIQETYQFVYQNYIEGKHHSVSVVPLTPLPGTEVWEYAKSRGLVSDDMDWTRLDIELAYSHPEKFIYLNERMPREVFLGYIEKFGKLLWEINEKFAFLMPSVYHRSKVSHANSTD